MKICNPPATGASLLGTLILQKQILKTNFMKLLKFLELSFDEVFSRLKYLENKMDGITEPKQWEDSTDVCRRLQISKRTLSYLRESGVLPYTKLGRKVFFLQSDINDYMVKRLGRKTDTP